MKYIKINKLSVLKIGATLLLALCSTLTLAETANNQLRGGEIQSKAEHTYGKVEVKIYSQKVTGTTSTFFWWRDGGHLCGQQWNEIDIELLPVNNTYQSNPIWQTSDADCDIKRSEAEHGGNDGLYDRWVVYTLEWTPEYISWSHDGIEDRRITINDHASVNFINLAMKYCFNLWTQGTANPDWLGNVDFNALQNKPVYQFVDYFKFYDWNGNGFNGSPTTNIEFSSIDDIHNNFNVSNWEFGESKGFLSWSPDAVGVVDVGNGNSALWLGLFHSGQERLPAGGEIPSANGGGGGGGDPITIQAESAVQFNSLEIAGDQIGYISDGAWASYAAVNIASAGEYLVTYQVASDDDGGTIQLEQGGGGTIYGSVTVPVTGGWSNWTSVSHTVTLPAGNINFGLLFANGGFNLESFTISGLTQNTQVFNIQAEATTESSGLIVAGDSLGYIEDGSWAKYASISIPSAGEYIVTYQIAGENSVGVIQFEQAGGVMSYGSVNVPATGAWTNWTPLSHTVNLPAGELSYALAFPTGGFNIESFTVKAAN